MSEPKAENTAVDVILRLLIASGLGKSISPTDAARALAADGEDWRRHLQAVRIAAVQLARDGRLTILRHGQPIAPEAVRGVIRLALPMHN